MTMKLEHQRVERVELLYQRFRGSHLPPLFPRLQQVCFHSDNEPVRDSLRSKGTRDEAQAVNPLYHSGMPVSSRPCWSEWMKGQAPQSGRSAAPSQTKHLAFRSWVPISEPTSIEFCRSLTIEREMQIDDWAVLERFPKLQDGDTYASSSTSK